MKGRAMQTGKKDHWMYSIIRQKWEKVWILHLIPFCPKIPIDLPMN
jgi:hypothetical protein